MPSSRHVRKNNIETKAGKDTNTSAGPPKQMKRFLRPKADGEERVYLLLPVA